jgi:hypothetical protein
MSSSRTWTLWGWWTWFANAGGGTGAQDRLLDTITELGAPGSRVATESRPNPRPGDENKTKERAIRVRRHPLDRPPPPVQVI